MKQTNKQTNGSTQGVHSRSLLKWLLIVASFLFIHSRSNAQITVVNYCDCNFTLTITCGGSRYTSNNYAAGWPGTWASPITKIFPVSCCPNPMIDIVFDPIYSWPSTVSGDANSLEASGNVYSCYKISSCAPANAGFRIDWNPSTCTLTLLPPVGC